MIGFCVHWILALSSIGCFDSFGNAEVSGVFEGGNVLRNANAKGRIYLTSLMTHFNLKIGFRKAFDLGLCCCCVEA